MERKKERKKKAKRVGKTGRMENLQIIKKGENSRKMNYERKRVIEKRGRKIKKFHLCKNSFIRKSVIRELERKSLDYEKRFLDEKSPSKKH